MSRPAWRTLAVLVALTAVVTAGAPSVIRVRSGDSLWELAQRHGTTVETLRRLNGLEGRATIYAGQLLKVPGARTRTVERGYTVRPGDNVSTIARRYGVSTRTIIVRNRLPRDGKVLVGRRLAIPVTVTVGGGRRATPTSTETHNAGHRIPTAVRSSVAHNRAVLADRKHPSKREVRRMVAKTARKLDVDVSLALAVAYHESGFQQRVVSPVNAIGVMQVLPSTGAVLSRQYGRRLDLLKAQDNVLAGVLLLRQLQRATGSTRMTLAGYYQGLGSISRKGLLPQTHTYIRNVEALRPRFRNG